MNDEELSRRLKAALPRHEAPPELAANIRANLAAGTNPRVDDGAGEDALESGRLRSWPRIAAILILVAIASSALMTLAMQWRAPGPGVTDQVLASHIRSLMPGHLTDVASTDEHNVKPWFNGRVNVSPPVPRLDSAGYPLVGGRLDYIEGRATAAVVYARRAHMINVFEWAEPGSHDIVPTVGMENGYHFIWERRDGLERWIVSDLNIAELEDFAQKYATAR